MEDEELERYDPGEWTFSSTFPRQSLNYFVLPVKQSCKSVGREIFHFR